MLARTPRAAGSGERQEVVTVFLGTHSPRLDDKNRVILPARYRDFLADGLVMSKGQDRCVVVWTKDGFAKYAEELAMLIGCEPEDCFRVSGKTGEGVQPLLDEIVRQVPAPSGDADAPARTPGLEAWRTSRRSAW